MPITKQPFGRSGHINSRTIFGAASLSNVTQQDADQTLPVPATIRSQPHRRSLRLRRRPIPHRPLAGPTPAPSFYVATKTDAHTAQEAKEDLHRSLERMGIDFVDLWQFHNLVDPIDWDTALSPGGAIDAAIEAKKQGLIRAIGVTGHGLQIAATHRRSLARFDFDSVLLPYNYITMQNPYYAENFNALLATCQQRNVAVQTIKSIAYKPWMGRKHTRDVWYEPLEQQQHIDTAVHWVLKQPGIFLNTVGDIHLLPRVLEAANRFQPDTPEPTEEQMRQLVTQLGFEPLFV